MPVNPYFNHTTYTPEQELVNDLMIEAIQIHGHDAFYLRREDVNLDAFFGEDTSSRFEQAYPIEIYLKSSASFQGQSEFISKFGLHIEDQATFLVSTTRFDQVVNGALVRPREGDLIYIQMTPTNRYLFEIRFVENKEQLFQLGRLYTYELRCEIMNYSHERVETSISEIDGVAEHSAYTIAIALENSTGTYFPDEIVYQGSSFLAATAQAKVVEWNPDTDILLVQNIVGEFNSTDPVIGLNSSTSRLPLRTPDTAPTERDPISDNAFLETTDENTIVVRHPNPFLS